MTKIIVSPDESLGGILREYVVERVDVAEKGSFRLIERELKTPIDIIIHEGARYKLADREAEVGEKVFVKDSEDVDECNRGMVYTVTSVYDNLVNTDGLYEDGSVLNLTVEEYRVLEPVESEPIEVTADQASPAVIEMLANLVTRIVGIEKELNEYKALGIREHLREGNCTIDNSIRRINDEIDTLHANQKRLSEDVEANDYAIDEINGKIGHLEADADESIVIVELAKLLVESHRKGSRL